MNEDMEPGTPLRALQRACFPGLLAIASSLHLGDLWGVAAYVQDVSRLQGRWRGSSCLCVAVI